MLKEHTAGLLKFNAELFSGMLLACMPKSRSTFTANTLVQRDEIRKARMCPRMDPHAN